MLFKVIKRPSIKPWTGLIASFRPTLNSGSILFLSFSSKLNTLSFEASVSFKFLAIVISYMIFDAFSHQAVLASIQKRKK